MNETSRKGNIVVGVMLVLIGVALTLDRSGIVRWDSQWTLWPFILLGIGLARFVGSPAGEPKQGLLFMTLGGWLLLGEAGAISVEDSWPILVIAIGLIIALNGVPRRRRRWHGGPETATDVPPVPGAPTDGTRRRHHHRSDGALTGLAVVGIWIAVFVAFQVSGIRTLSETTSSDRVRVISVMGRSEHTSRATTFEGADVTNLMGRSELDLREATLAPGDDATVRVVSAMGAVVLRVPQGWTVDTGAVSALGGVVDERSRSLEAESTPGPRPRLRLSGLVMFGRLTIRS
jgi:hypothetical protein